MQSHRIGKEARFRVERGEMPGAGSYWGEGSGRKGVTVRFGREGRFKTEAGRS